eukprot:gene12309-15472_t
MLLSGLTTLFRSGQRAAATSLAQRLPHAAKHGASQQRWSAIHERWYSSIGSSTGYTMQTLPVATKYIMAGGAGVTAVISATFFDDGFLPMMYHVPARLGRDILAAGTIVVDYKTSLGGKEGEERMEALHACHQRSADRLLHLCFANGGIYTKLGQHIGQLDHLLPEEYVSTLRDNLLDKCPVSDYQEVRRIFSEDFGGATPETLFASFDPIPIASASLAQVHVARDNLGNKLAIKVQHAGLKETAAADIATIEFLVKSVKWIFPDFDFQWLVDEIKQNLPLELDFLHEASNAERCRHNLLSPRSRLGPSKVHVPSVDPSRSSVRVLTMEFVDGVGVTDVLALEKAGISAGEVARLVSETFAEMMFIHGDVHCDPHAANMMVRKQGGKTQLVLLDHGLYRRIDDDFRLEYAKLWRGLIFADVDAITKASEAMGAGHAVLERKMEHLVIPPGAEHREKLQQYAQEYSKEISDMFVKMPRPLLLLLKTNDCLRAVDKALGQTVNTFAITARECSRALAEDCAAAGRGSWRSKLSVVLASAEIELFVVVMKLTAWWARLFPSKQAKVEGQHSVSGTA